MPLIVIVGWPSSGKTTITAEIAEYFQKTGRLVEVVGDEELLRFHGRNKLYRDSHLEKDVRASLKGMVQRKLTPETIVILDSLNYIKGYRYELYCLAKEHKTNHCIVEMVVNKETVKTRNSQRSKDMQYDGDILDQLIMRYEVPDSKNRWDSPLLPVSREVIDLEMLSSILFDQMPVTSSSLSTQSDPFADSSYIDLEFLAFEAKESEKMCLLIQHGRHLMENDPERTTKFAIQLARQYLEDSSVFSMTKSTDAIDPLDSTLVDLSLEDLLNIFILNKYKMLEFLEAVIEDYPKQSPSSFYHTLLGLYLRRINNVEIDQEDRQNDSRKAVELLQRSGATYDINYAIILCSIHEFNEGLLYLYWKDQKIDWILQHHIANNDVVEVVRTCRHLGKHHTNLFVDTLWFFGDYDGEIKEDDLLFVLKQVEENKLLPPMSVIKILSKNSNIPLGVLREFLSSFVSEESKVSQENSKEIDRLKVETEKMQKSIADIENPKLFQAFKCSCCNALLEPPAIHFYCGHSYHQKCFEGYSIDAHSECPLCLPENVKLLEEINKHLRVKDQSLKLMDELEQPDTDAFSTVSSFLSKGLLNEGQASSSSVRK